MLDRAADRHCRPDLARVGHDVAGGERGVLGRAVAVHQGAAVARREHGATELQHKLAQRGIEQERAAEVVAGADLLAPDPRRGQPGADRILLAFPVEAQHREPGDARHLGARLRPGLIGADPVGNTDFEGGVAVDAEEADARHLRAQVGGQAIDHERQHVGTEGIADQEHALLVPGAQVMPQDARYVARGLIRCALLPEVLE